MQDALALALVHFLWQGAVLTAIGAILLRLARASATARYAIGVATLCAMAAAPVVTATWIYQTTPAELALMDGATGTTAAGVDTNALGADVGIAPAQVATQETGPAFPYAVPVLLVWALGVAVFATRLAGGWLIARRLATRAIAPVSAQVDATARRLGSYLRLSRPVRILESSAVAVPVMIGWFKPVILLPTAALAGLPPDQLEALLAHELAHVRRHDYLVNLLQSVVETMLFYHPGVWWMSRRVRVDREHCCDDLAVSVTERVTYVTALSHVAALAAPGLALAASDGSLRGRVRRLLGPERDRRSGGGWLAVLPIVIVVAAAAPLAVSPAVEVMSPATEAVVETESPLESPSVRTVQAEPLDSEGVVSRSEAAPAPPTPLTISSSSLALVDTAGGSQLGARPPVTISTADVTAGQVRPGETITVNVDGRPELSGTYVVQPDGTIKLKGVEDSSIEVIVSGAVRMPGVKRLSGQFLSLNRALADAGGLLPNAGDVVEILAAATNDLPARTVTVERSELDLRGGFRLRDGDRVNVPRAQRFFVNGQVNSQGEHPWFPGMTVAKALSLANGSASDFSLQASSIRRPVRATNGTVSHYEEIGNLAMSTEIGPDDTFMVAAQDPVFYVNGEVNEQGEKPWKPGMTVGQALALAGGPTDKFSLGRSKIVRPVKDADGKVIRHEEVKRLKLETAILPGDTLIAGRKWM